MNRRVIFRKKKLYQEKEECFCFLVAFQLSNGTEKASMKPPGGTHSRNKADIFFSFTNWELRVERDFHSISHKLN